MLATFAALHTKIKERNVVVVPIHFVRVAGLCERLERLVTMKLL